MKKLASLGTNLLIARRSGTRVFTLMLAVAQARPVIGSMPPP
ncbi:MAG TPA: hypothetical protein VHB50_01770 [Bryobacteraceae bacterium]|nr:hypothetical protein [Bryobacteraceae bacterium]